MIRIADLKPNGKDAMGASVAVIYGFKPPDYAVYRTDDRVLVQFADAEDRACKQRTTLAPLNPLRGEINGLIDRWRKRSRNDGRRTKAERYDRRVGDALVVAFESDVCGAELLLKAIKQDVLDERTALARLQYLWAAFVVGIVAMGTLALSAKYLVGTDQTVLNLIRAASTGAVGAFFSIALAIRSRTVLPDLQWVSNTMDAVLRMVIGVIAGGVLMAFVAAGVVNIEFGSAVLGGAEGTPDPAALQTHHWLFVLIVGFIAGFSERFVPDLLAKSAVTTVAPVVAPVPAPLLQPAHARDVESVGDGSTVRQEEPLSDESASDVCASEVDVPDGLVTADNQLPPATGGVAKAEAA